MKIVHIKCKSLSDIPFVNNVENRKKASSNGSFLYLKEVVLLFFEMKSIYLTGINK